MAEAIRYGCRSCRRTDLTTTWDNSLRKHTANGKRRDDDNPYCLGKVPVQVADIEDAEHRRTAVSAPPNPHRDPLPGGLHENAARAGVAVPERVSPRCPGCGHDEHTGECRELRMDGPPGSVDECGCLDDSDLPHDTGAVPSADPARAHVPVPDDCPFGDGGKHRFAFGECGCGYEDPNYVEPAPVVAARVPVVQSGADVLMGGTPHNASETDGDPMDVLMAEDPPADGTDKLYRNGRYALPDPLTGNKRTWTRATTMAETLSDLYSLNLWRIRMVLIGLARFPDLLDELQEIDGDGEEGKLDPKIHKDILNKIGGKAQTLAGSKVPASWGTEMHTCIERLSRDEVTLEEVPEKYRDEVTAWAAAMQEAELSAVPHLIERRIAVPMYGTAGTLDQVDRVHRGRSIRLGNRIIRLAAGDHIIGDVKGLALTERIPTPDGWTTMGEIRPGDRVFDAYGTPCTVTEKSPVKKIGTYVVTFDDGSHVVCDTEHIWWTASGFNARPPFAPTAKPVSEIIDTLRGPNGAHHRVPVAGPLDLPDADLPIDPYLLGCWLGDGHARGGVITKGRDLFEILEADGHRLGVEQFNAGQLFKPEPCTTRTVLGLGTRLRAAGLLHNKHIPAAYLRASIGQRTRLLQGLMDTDGTWNTARHSAAFSTTDKGLAYQVEELMLSLGQRPHVAYLKRRGFDLMVDSWTVEITPVDLQPFRLPRKADQAAASVKSVTRSRRRVITSVLPGPDVETACIAVDASTHTYLCGDRMIPTHNSGRDLDYEWGEISIQMAIYAHGLREGRVAVWDPEADSNDPEDPGAWVWEDSGIPPKSVRTDVGVVMHVPIGSGECTLHWIDLEEGWKAVQLCEAVRDWRKVKGLHMPFSIAEVATSKPPVVRAPDWDERFSAVTTVDQARAVYRQWLASGGDPDSPDAKRLVKISKTKISQLTESTA